MTKEYQLIGFEENRYWNKFMAAGVYAVWKEWLVSGQVEPIEEITTLIRKVQSGN